MSMEKHPPIPDEQNAAPRSQWRHRLRDIDPEKRQAICAACGLVPVIPRNSGKSAGGRKWACYPHWKEVSGGSEAVSQEVLSQAIQTVPEALRTPV